MPKLITTQTRIEDLGKPRVVIFGSEVGTTLQRLLYRVTLSAREATSISSRSRNHVSVVTSLGEYSNGSSGTDQPRHKPPLTRFEYKCAMTTTDRNKKALNVSPPSFPGCFAWVSKSFQHLHVPIRFGNKISSLPIGSPITFALTKATAYYRPSIKMTCTNNG